MSNHSFVIEGQQAQEAAPGDILELAGAEAHHAVTVKRVTAGEHLDLLDGKGLRLTVEVTATAKDLLSVKVLRRTEEAISDHPVTLVQALSKGDRDLQAVESGVELGVLAVRPWQAERSIVRWNAAKVDKAMAKWRAQVRSAQKQSRRAYEPEVLAPLGSKELAKTIADRRGQRGTGSGAPRAGREFRSRAGYFLAAEGPRWARSHRDRGTRRRHLRHGAADPSLMPEPMQAPCWASMCCALQPQDLPRWY